MYIWCVAGECYINLMLSAATCGGFVLELISAYLGSGKTMVGAPALTCVCLVLFVLSNYTKQPPRIAHKSHT
jgi:hypothetical protein